MPLAYWLARRGRRCRSRCPEHRYRCKFRVGHGESQHGHDWRFGVCWWR